jgi:hypothetical protein
LADNRLMGHAARNGRGDTSKQSTDLAADRRLRCPAARAAGTSSSSSPADPVAILRETGATPDPGTASGGHDVYGDRDASGSFPGGESVTVYTCASQAASWPKKPGRRWTTSTAW